MVSSGVVGTCRARLAQRPGQLVVFLPEHGAETLRCVIQLAPQGEMRLLGAELHGRIGTRPMSLMREEEKRRIVSATEENAAVI
ncbi:hypothetical protein MKZ38_000527 [Zalerion maritima]|uniref:Uncharacterized protein n=1 Tax=Zalerion maritima TaxID=339359 RepID=A0AAD5WS04_9PEZI|nr:hypothetical protein MKZ38_000527 [Zalerion maritima]